MILKSEFTRGVKEVASTERALVFKASYFKVSEVPMFLRLIFEKQIVTFEQVIKLLNNQNKSNYIEKF